MVTEEEKYINPLTDFGFKKLFGSEPNKDLLIDFLNEIIPDRTVSDLNYSTNEHFGKSELDRKAIFDIYCIGENGDRFIVEMQKAKQNFFKDRSIFYSSFPIQEQAKKKDWNYKLDAVYSIGILDFIFDDHKNENELFHLVELKNQRCEVFYEKLKFVYIELPKFTKDASELETRFDKWLYVFTHLWKLQNRPKELQERIFKKLFEVAEIAKFSEDERKAYEDSLKNYRDIKNVVDTAREEGVEIGMEKGVEIGIEKGANDKSLEIAESLKKQGVPFEIIAESTGISIEKIEKL